MDPSNKHIQEDAVLPMIDSMNPLTWLKSGQKILARRPDLVIFPWWVSFWAPQFWTISSLIRLFGKSKILFLCHNVVEHESKWIDKILTRFALKKGDFFITHSKEDQENLLSMFPQANIKRSFHPTYEVFNFGNFDGDLIKRKYRIEGKVILFFGFVREYKGLKYLIRALPKVLSKIKVTLLVVGEFWKDKNDYTGLIKELEIENNVILVDEYVPNEEIGYFFSAADIIVQPYTSATGSGVIQTAFGFNKAVIATRVGCLPEVVDDEKTGYLVPARDSEAIANAVVSFYKEGKDEEFMNNIMKEKEKFSWDRMVETIESFQ